MLARFAYILAMLLLIARPGAAEETVKVGVFENRPIIFQQADGRWAGLAVDVLEATAREEG